MPLCDAVLGLCSSVHGLDDLETIILDEHPAKFASDRDRSDAKYDVKRFFSSMQSAAAFACDVASVLRDQASDPNAKTMRRHPLTNFAAETVRASLSLLTLLSDVSGVSAITKKLTRLTADATLAFTFNINIDPHDSRWASKQADAFWKERVKRQRRWMDRYRELDATWPKVDPHEIERELHAFFDRFAKKHGLAYAASDVPVYEKYLAVKEYVRLH